MSEALYAVVNDNPAFTFTDGQSAFTICTEANSAGTQAIYTEKSRAFRERDQLREEFDNPDINVYKIRPEPATPDEETADRLANAANDGGKA